MSPIETAGRKNLSLDGLFEELTNARINDPERVMRVAQLRQRRKQFTTGGRLNILAADHPARRVTRAGADAMVMGDRLDFLSRIVQIVTAQAVDGVMATMDVLEELLLLHDLMLAKGEPGFLDNKLLLASLNRGGLHGVAWEMNDPMTSASAQQVHSMRLDGVKLLWRVCDEDSGSLETLKYCVAAINESARLNLPTFLEPLPVVKEAAGFKVVKTAAALVPLVGAASALGDSSRYLWLKLPYCPDFASIARATTLPIVMLGGESGNTQQFLSEIREGLAAQHNVRGAMIGRNVMYPANGDPVAVAAAVHGIVHNSNQDSWVQ